jgi:hypothetical protein
VSVRLGRALPHAPGADGRPLLVEDPFEPALNLYRSRDPFGGWRIRCEMERAARLLGGGGGLAEVCEPVATGQIDAMRKNFRALVRPLVDVGVFADVCGEKQKEHGSV